MQTNWQEHNDDFSKPLLTFPADDILEQNSETFNFIYNTRMMGPKYDVGAKYFQDGLKRCHDHAMLDKIDFTSAFFDRNTGSHPDVPHLRGIFTHPDNERYVALRTRSGGNELWHYDEVYATFNDWEDGPEYAPIVSGYPNNNTLRQKATYCWDEGDSAGDNYHLFFFSVSQNST